MRVRGSTWKFYFGLGAWYVCIERRWLVVSRHLVFSRRLVLSPQGGAGNPNCHVFFRFSMGSFHGVPVTVLPSSIFFNSGGTAQLRSCYPQYRGTCMPGCQRCRFRLNGPDQGLGDNAQSHMNGKDSRCCSYAVQAPAFPWWSGNDISSEPPDSPDSTISFSRILQGVVRVGNKVRRSTRPVERRSPHKVCSCCIRRVSSMRKRRNCVFKQSVRSRKFRGP